MTGRAFDLIHKGWTYLLTALAQPKALPSFLWQVGARRVHAGELLKLNQHKTWLKGAGIKTVIDVGAHTGEFTFAVRSVLPTVQIYAFEPLPDCYRELSARLENEEKAQAFGVALGSEGGEVTFWANDFSKASSALPMSDLHKDAFPWTAKSTPIAVQVQKLDHYADQMTLAPAVMLKMDVQGYECQVLQGGLRVLERADYVLVETSFENLYEGQSSFHDVYELLTAQGFAYKGSFDQMLSPLDGAILQADALFVRVDS